MLCVVYIRVHHASRCGAPGGTPHTDILAPACAGATDNGNPRQIDPFTDCLPRGEQLVRVQLVPDTAEKYLILGIVTVRIDFSDRVVCILV